MIKVHFTYLKIGPNEINLTFSRNFKVGLFGGEMKKNKKDEYDQSTSYAYMKILK
jgi:hypothetical protein